MELPDILGSEAQAASQRLVESGWEIVRKTTQPVKAAANPAGWRVVRVRRLGDRRVEILVAPVAEESCSDWSPAGGIFY